MIGFSAAIWNHDGTGSNPGREIIIPLKIKPLTTYRMRDGRIAWTSGLIKNGCVYGLIQDATAYLWRITDGRRNAYAEHELDLIEELPGATE